MGVVRRQGLKRSVVSYIGVCLGALSNLFIYPLSFEMYGLAQFIIASAGLIIPFASLGISRLTVRFFPHFREDNLNHHGFLNILLLFTVVGFAMFFLLFYIVGNVFFNLLELLSMKPSVFKENILYIGFVSFFLVMNSVLTAHASNLKRVVIPEIFNNLIFKISLPILVYLHYLSQIDTGTFKLLFSSTYVLAFLLLSGYLQRLNQLSFGITWSFIDGKLLREMVTYGAFSAISSIGYLLSFRIDNVMITSFMGGTENTGFYSFFAYMVNMIVIPYMAVTAISAPLVADHFSKQNFKPIAALYTQSSEILYFIGLFIILGLWLCMDDILILTRQEGVLAPLKVTFLILSAGQLVNVTTGLNEVVIAYSRYFRFNLYALLILAILNVGMNIILIPGFGIIGAAWATAISLTIYNLVKCVYIYFRFKILPFSIVHAKVSAIAVFSFAVLSIVEIDGAAFIDLLVRGSLFSLIYLSLNYYFDICKQVNNILIQTLTKIRTHLAGNKSEKP